jgi:hypothetical protein
LDYEIVILLSGSGRFGFPNFVSWSTHQAPPTKTEPSTPQVKETIMKSTVLIAALAATFAASGAMAQEATYEYPQPAVSALTRAQVQTELAAARADGSIKAWSTSYNPLAMARSTLSRETVKAELHAGLSHALVGEDSGSFALSHQKSGQLAPATFAMGRK